MTAFRKIHFNLRSLQKEASQVRMLTRFFLPGEQTCSYREWTLYGCHFTFLNMTYFFLSCRNPSYFSTPNTRTDIYPPLGNLSLTGVRLEDHSSLLSFSPGRPVEINSVTTTRPGDTYSPFSAGVSVPKTSPPKVRGGGGGAAFGSLVALWNQGVSFLPEETASNWSEFWVS